MNITACLLLVTTTLVCLCQGADIGALRAKYNRQQWRHNYATSSRLAFCRYGAYRRRNCCYGWRHQDDSQCAPICEDGCGNGKCVGPNRCQCEKGWTGAACDRDFNECSTGPCSHRCVNGMGSFRCFCPTGHVLLEDKVTCVLDYRCSIDKCAYGCEQVGYSFRCLCPDGLKVSSNGFHCEDIDECELGLVKCPPDQRCRNTYGNYMCMCREGYAFQMINRRLICKERDLCVVKGLVCDVNAFCEESNGDARCVCNLGYVGDGETCRLIDINECSTGDFECDNNAQCINTQGSYECRCNEGFVGDGKQCVPLDQTTCADQPCFQGVRCFDIPLNPSAVDLDTAVIVKLYRCADCPPGYEGDGEFCADKNECEDGSFVCHVDAACINTESSYSCACKEGFAGDGRDCVPLDPRTCSDRPCSPGVQCEDIPLQRILNSPNWRQLDIIQLFRCGSCPRGFVGDGETCRDVNECDQRLDNCHVDATCINTPGSYQCECNEGFAGTGVLCVRVDPRRCSDQPCFNGRVECTNLDIRVIVRTIDLANTAIIKLFQCGQCPDGYFGNGETCQDIDECSLNLFECHAEATCVNTDGGYQCICNPGWAGDGKRCREIDPTECQDRPCFGGVVCTEVPLIVANLDLETDDLIRLYRCGECPPGYRGNGETCSDIDECVENSFFCPNENSSCVNIPGTYYCECNPGFYGDGQTCIPLDSRTCADQPCFEGVDCTVVDPATIDWRSLDVVRLFECGDCPEGFVGDGEDCKKLPPPIVIPKDVNLTVVTIGPRNKGQPLVSGTKITAFIPDGNTGTIEYASALTSPSGVTKIPVPHNKTVMVTTSHKSYLSTSMSYKAHLHANNTLTLEMLEFTELTEFLWRTQTSRALEFGDLLRLEIPQGGLRLPDGQRVSIECRPLNITLMESPSEGPELVAGITNPFTGAVEMTGLEVFGMTELKCYFTNRRQMQRPPVDNLPFTISMPVIDLIDDPEAPLFAWRYHDDKGYWVYEGEIAGVTGVTSEDGSVNVNQPNVPAEDEVTRLMWQYHARNFTYSWWAFGRAWPSTSCVTVRACRDAACNLPIEHALIQLYGVDFRYTASRYTSANGTVCFPYKLGGEIVISAPCINYQRVISYSRVMPASSCPADESQGFVTPIKDSKQPCLKETILFPRDIDPETCPDPGQVEGAVRYGDDFTHGNEVSYICNEQDFALRSKTRVCTKCGQWSGEEPSCRIGGVSDYYSNY